MFSILRSRQNSQARCQWSRVNRLATIIQQRDTASRVENVATCTARWPLRRRRYGTPSSRPAKKIANKWSQTALTLVSLIDFRNPEGISAKFSISTSANALQQPMRVIGIPRHGFSSSPRAQPSAIHSSLPFYHQSSSIYFTSPSIIITSIKKFYDIQKFFRRGSNNSKWGSTSEKQNSSLCEGLIIKIANPNTHEKLHSGDAARLFHQKSGQKFQIS